MFASWTADGRIRLCERLQDAIIARALGDKGFEAVPYLAWPDWIRAKEQAGWVREGSFLVKDWSRVLGDGQTPSQTPSESKEVRR